VHIHPDVPEQPDPGPVSGPGRHAAHSSRDLPARPLSGRSGRHGAANQLGQQARRVLVAAVLCGIVLFLLIYQHQFRRVEPVAAVGHLNLVSMVSIAGVAGLAISLTLLTVILVRQRPARRSGRGGRGTRRASGRTR
jgi:hypothetical protein